MKADHRLRKYRLPLSKDDKRDLILSAARRLFMRDGFHETSMEDIADALGHTKPFIYFHFESKERLLLALVADADDFDAACRWLGVGGKTIRRVRALALEEAAE